jgi:L-fuconolactonase
VIDHLAKPKIKTHSISDWEPHFRAAAKRPNVYCKLSGMITEADWKNWKPADLRPYVDIALDCFGPNRLMFGTDWPVCELAGSYEQVHGATTELLAKLTPSEQARIFGGTAREFYSLRV